MSQQEILVHLCKVMIPLISDITYTNISSSHIFHILYATINISFMNQGIKLNNKNDG